MTTQTRQRGSQYYAERLLSQAISDPALDEWDEDAVHDYIKEEAEKLCLDGEAVAEYAMRGYRSIVDGGGFRRASKL
jgi:hypothetical protein